MTAEKFDRSHQVFRKDVADAYLPAASTVVYRVVNRRDGRVVAEMAVGDECAPRALVGGISFLVIQLDAPRPFGMGENRVCDGNGLRFVGEVMVKAGVIGS